MTSVYSPEPPSARPADPICILIVNDDVDGLYLLKVDVRRAFPHARILTAERGEEGLSLWDSEHVDAIITDNRMPGISGMVLARSVREADSRVPIVMVTCSEEVREEAEGAGVTLFSADNRVVGVIAELKACLESMRPG